MIILLVQVPLNFIGILKNMLYVPVIRKCHTAMKRDLAWFVLAQFYPRNAMSLTLFFDIEH